MVSMSCVVVMIIIVHASEGEAEQDPQGLRGARQWHGVHGGYRHIYIYIYTYIHAYIHIHVCMCIYTHIHT